MIQKVAHSSLSSATFQIGYRPLSTAISCGVFLLFLFSTQSSQAESKQTTNIRSVAHQSQPALHYFRDSGVTVYPLVGTRISSRFGMRVHPVIHKQRHHHGLDLSAPIDAPVRSIREGRVIFADPFGAYGKLVVIEHENQITSHYGHLNSIRIQTGDLVSAGQVIGAVGKTGRVTGAHLHFEIRHAGKSQDPLILFPHIAQAGHG